MGVVEKEQWMIEKMVQASALYLLKRIGSCYFAGLGWRHEIVEDNLDVSVSTLISLYFGKSQARIQES